MTRWRFSRNIRVLKGTDPISNGLLSDKLFLLFYLLGLDLPLDMLARLMVHEMLRIFPSFHYLGIFLNKWFSLELRVDKLLLVLCFLPLKLFKTTLELP